MCDVGLLVTKTHGPDEACGRQPCSRLNTKEHLTFVFDRPTSKVGTNKSRLLHVSNLPSLLPPRPLLPDQPTFVTTRFHAVFLLAP